VKIQLFRKISLGLATFFSVVLFSSLIFGQTSDIRPMVRIGEKLTYNIAIDHLDNAAYAETYVVSTGKIGDRDAIEIRTRFKTLSLASAAFFMVDESTTTYMSPVTGMPLYTRREEFTTGLPKATVREFTDAPAAGHDLNTLMVAIRNSGQPGTYSAQGVDRTFGVTVQVIGPEAIKTDTGNYETTAFSIQSEFFTERGISDVKVNLSNDEARIPVFIKFKTAKGEIRATVAGVQVIQPEVEVEPAPQPTETPRPAPTPKPTATPEVYVDNRPLSTDLPFVLGESLEYRVSTGGIDIGSVTMRAESRNEIQTMDSLLLTATVVPGGQGNAVLRAGDFLRSRVNPDSLTPLQFEIRLNSAGNQIEQTANFDPRTSVITFGGTPVEAPAGTHSVLSLLYAMRSFNLKPSRDNNNPTNDTRVAVFWDGKATIFFLRPSAPALLEIGGEKFAAQQVSVTTNNPQLEALAPKIWLSNDARRTPLRITLGAYQLDLVKSSVIAPK
jgi:hypothetical protein